MKNKTTLIAIGMAAALALPGCHKKEKATPPEAYRVEVAVVDSTDISASRTYSGTVEASSESNLSFAVAGTMRSINVEQGDQVKKGQLIASLDPASLQNAHAISLAALNEAQDTYNRMKKLHDSKSLSDMKWVEVENALRSAQNAEAISRRAVADANLYAPFSGYVAEKLGEAGTNVAPGIPVVKIVDIDPIKVSISVPEGEIANFAVGQEAIVSGSGLQGRTAKGKVSERGVAASLLSHTYDVLIELPNPDAQLLPGMICDVRMVSENPVPAIVVPNAAVLLDARNRNFVWVAADGKAHRRLIEIDGMADSGIIVASGLQPGDSVIVSGQQKVSEGSPIDVINR